MTEKQISSCIVAHVFNGDRSQVAVCKGGRDVFIYEVKGEDSSKWKLKHTLSQHAMTVTCVDWSAATNMIVTCGHDRNAYVWRLEEDAWKPQLVILRIGRAACWVRWSADGKKFAVASSSKQIPVCHYEASQSMWVATTIKKSIKSTVLSLDWHPSGNFLIAGGCDFRCRIYSAFLKDVDSQPAGDPFASLWKDATKFGALLAEFDQAKGWIKSCSWSPAGDQFVFVGHDSSIHFGAIDAKEINTQSIRFAGLPFESAAFLDENTVVAGGHDASPYRFNKKGSEWVDEGRTDTGQTAKTAAPKTKKKGAAFAGALAMFETSTSQGKKFGKKGKSERLESRHQNAITQILPWYEGSEAKKYSSTGLDGRLLIWDAAKSY